jgi:hypothetical protein
MLWFINSFAGFASAIARWCCGHLYKRSLLKKLVANHFLIQFPCIFLKQLKRTWNQRIGRFCSVDTTFNWVCCPWYFPRYFFGWTGASCELLPSYLEWLNSNVFFGRNDGEPSVSCAPFCFSSHSKSKLTRHLHVFLFSFEWTLSPFFSLFFFLFACKSLEPIEKDTANTQGAVESHLTCTCSTFGNKTENDLTCVTWLSFPKSHESTKCQVCEPFGVFRPCATSINSSTFSVNAFIS